MSGRHRLFYHYHSCKSLESTRAESSCDGYHKSTMYSQVPGVVLHRFLLALRARLVDLDPFVSLAATMTPLGRYVETPYPSAVCVSYVQTNRGLLVPGEQRSQFTALSCSFSGGGRRHRSSSPPVGLVAARGQRETRGMRHAQLLWYPYVGCTTTEIAAKLLKQRTISLR